MEEEIHGANQWQGGEAVSVSVTVSMTGNDPGFIIAATVAPARMEALNRLLAERLSDELKDHFRKRNTEPNRMNAPKTNFWNQLEAATAVSEVSATGAAVTVAEERFRIHLYGGTIRPKTAKALTIPLIPEARGKFTRDYERSSGKKLFSLPGVNVLFEKNKDGATSTTLGEQSGRIKRNGTTRSIKVRSRTPLRAVYALAKSATIRKDEKALPPMNDLVRALVEEAEDFISRERGGAA